MVTTSKQFCPKCGRETQEEGLCQACFAEKYVVFELPQVMEVRICAKCPSYKIGDAWVDTSLQSYEELVKKATNKTVRLALVVNKEVSRPQITVVPEFTGPQILRVHVRVTGDIGNRPVATDADVEVRVRKETCDVCSRIAGGYYEGTIQIRAKDRFPSKEEVKRCLKIVENTIVRAAKSGDRLAFITDVFPLPEGADVYIGSSTCGRQASRAIIDEFGGTVTEAPKLVGCKDGKDLYRITFAVRLPDIVAGDIVKMQQQGHPGREAGQAHRRRRPFQRPVHLRARGHEGSQDIGPVAGPEDSPGVRRRQIRPAARPGHLPGDHHQAAGVPQA